jgi:hypothetical protein
MGPGPIRHRIPIAVPLCATRSCSAPRAGSTPTAVTESTCAPTSPADPMVVLPRFCSGPRSSNPVGLMRRSAADRRFRSRRLRAVPATSAPRWQSPWTITASTCSTPGRRSPCNWGRAVRISRARGWGSVGPPTEPGGSGFPDTVRCRRIAAVRARHDRATATERSPWEKITPWINPRPQRSSTS